MSYVLNAQKRETAGKGAARAIRREGLVPAVIYGDKKDPISVSLDPKELWLQLHTGQTFFASTGTIQIGKTKENVICRDVQFHPVKDFPMHADFLRLGKDATVVVEIPVSFINEEQSEGIKRGGVLNVVRHEIECSVPANAMPEALIVDLSGTAIGDSVHISAVELPKGVEPTISDRDFTICSIAAPSSGEKAVDEGEEGDEEAEATEE